MTRDILADNILKLEISERMQLVEEIWDSIVANPDAVPITEGQRAEIDRCLAGQQKHPKPGSPWLDVKRRITHPK